MARLILFLAVLIAGAGVVLCVAGSLASHGNAWAAELWSAAPFLCDRPLVAGIGVVGIVWLGIVVKIVSALHRYRVDDLRPNPVEPHPQEPVEA